MTTGTTQEAYQTTRRFSRMLVRGDIVPGLGLCLVLLLVAGALGRVQEAFQTRATFEPLVLALLLAIIVGNAVRLPASTVPGVRFAGRTVLNAAVALLGASINLRQVAAGGPQLLALVLLTVVGGVSFGWCVGRLLGLQPKLAVLVAVGNSICGNSAIAATAPAIGASREDVATSVSLTALVGVGHVLLLPLVVTLIGMGDYRYGVLAGLTVYSVPQVIAAAFHGGTAVVDLAVLVKLTRVVLLGPTVLVLSLLFARTPTAAGSTPRLSRIASTVPWFILCFFVFATARTLGIIPDTAASNFKNVSAVMFIVSMAGIGFEVQLSQVRNSVVGVAVATLVSLAFLSAFSLAGMAVLGMHG